MKTKLSLILLLSFIFNLLSSQIPQGFNYQAIARDAVSGNPITEPVNVMIAILATDASTIIYEEEHSSVDPDEHGLFNLVVGQGSWESGVADFSDIDWTVGPKYIRTSIYYGGSWKVLDPAQLWSVPYAMVADSLGGPLKKLEVEGETDDMEESLFEVRNTEGKIVFAVYNEGVRIYVSDGDAKGPKGGFAIGGFGTVKQDGDHHYFFVSGDSIRAYIDSTSVKGVKGGFAIGSFEKTKGETQDYLKVTRDSVRIYLDANPATKGPKGGFAIGSFEKNKGGESFFNVTMDETGIVDPSENRILWYPLKNAFRTGKVLVEKKDSVGENSFASGFESKAVGNYSQAMGYKAIARGKYSTAIGDSAVATKSSSFSFGDMTLASGENAFAFGKESVASGKGSYAMGSKLISVKTQASKENSFALGLGCVSSGIGSVSMGTSNSSSADYSFSAGRGNTANKTGATALGHLVTSSGDYSTGLGYNTEASGNYSTALGYGTVASGRYSTAMGYGTQATAESAISAGINSIAQGMYSIAMGLRAHAYGPISIALGTDATASNQGSIAIGQNSAGTDWHAVALGYSNSAVYGALAAGFSTKALGTYSMSAGYQARALANYSVSIGNNPRARAENSTAMGFWSQSKGTYSFAMGRSVIAKSYGSFVVGQFNDTTSTSSTSWLATDPLFIVGNGTDSPYTLSNALTVLKNGRTGINTHSPAEMLDVNGNAMIRGAIYTASTNIELNGYGSGNRHAFIDFHGDDTNTDYALRIIRYNSGVNADSRIHHLGTGALQLYAQNAAAIRLYTSSAERMAVASNGYVGIGTASPAYKLHVVENNNVDNYAALIHHDGNNVDCQGLRIAAGLDTPGATKTVMIAFADGDNNAVGTVTLNNTGVQYNTTSDRRLKTKIGTSALKGIETVRKMPVVDFAFKTSPEYILTGFIAQDIEEIYPDAVSRTENGYYQIALPTLVPVLTKAIQEQQDQIESQQAQIEELKAMVEELMVK